MKAIFLLIVIISLFFSACSMENKTPELILASYNGDIKKVRHLISEGAEVNAKDSRGITSLIIASQEGYLEIVRVLVEEGAEINAKTNEGVTPLITTSEEGHLEIARILVEKGAEINAKANSSATSLFKASQNGHLEIVRILVEKGAEINYISNGGFTSLYIASQNGHLGIVRALVEKGAEVDLKTKHGTTPLIIASKNGHLEIVRALVKRGAEVNAKDKKDNTSLIIASQNGHLEIVRVLVEKGVEVNAKNNMGTTSLIIASQKGRLEIVRILVKKGAEINAKDKNDNTALMKAASNAQLIDILLTAGADLSISNLSGETALSFAARTGESEKVKALQIAMGSMNGSIDDVLLSHAEPILTIDSGGHTAIIRDILFSRDGKRLITASDDKTIQIWDVASGEIIRTLRGQIGAGHKGMIYTMALSPDEQILAVGGYLSGWAIRLIDLQSGQIKRLLKGHGDITNDLAFSADGRRLVSGSVRTARIWDVVSGKSLQVLKGHISGINAVAFSPDGERVVTGSDDNSLKLWQSGSGRLLADLSGHTGDVRSIAFSPDGETIFSGSRDKSIRLWDGHSGAFIKILARQDSSISSLSISPDGRRLVTGVDSFPLTINVFALPSGKKLTTFNRHNNAVVATAISADGQLTATGGGNNQDIYLWDINSGQVKQKLGGLGGTIWSVGFTKDGRSIAWGKHDHKKNSVFHLPKLEQTFQLNGSKSDRLQLGQVVTEQQQLHFQRALETVGNLSISTTNGKLHPTLQIKHHGRLTHEITRNATNGTVHRCLTLSPDGRTVISGGSHGALTAYSTKSGKITQEFVGHTSDVMDVTVSSDGRYLVSGSVDQTVKLWQISSGKLLLTIFQGSDSEWVAWTPEGYYTASPKGDRYVGWHVNKGEDQPADYYTARQFSRYLYRPDVVSDAVALGSSQKALAKAGLGDLTVADLIERAPVDVRIVGVQQRGVDEAEVRIKLGENKTTALERITLYINGAQVLTDAQRSLTGARPGDEFTYKIKLPEKTSHIHVTVENQWAETADNLTYDNPQWIDRDEPTGTLFVTAVGINRYPNLPQEQQLSSPGLDAASIADRFAQLEGRLFDKVVVNTLTDADGVAPITSAQVEQLLIAQAQQAGPLDTSIFFLAGHGVTDPTGSYHFVTTDSRIDGSLDGEYTIEQGSSFDWNRLHKVLDRTQGKRIVIVDTCQAGSVFTNNTVDVTKLVKDVHDLNALVYSGASRQQDARETNKGGVFTNAILSGIDGKAEYQQQLLPFQSLREYVDRDVPKRNREIMNAQLLRALKIDSNKGRGSEADVGGTQQPVAVVPDGMEGFVIYQR